MGQRAGRLTSERPEWCKISPASLSYPDAVQTKRRGLANYGGVLAPHLRPGLTAEAAGEICMHQCRAQCCRGPLVLQVTEEEALVLEAVAEELGVFPAIQRAADGGGWIRFSEHRGEHCPFLDDATSACRIYACRPQRCRDFPEKPTPGCPISGSV